MQTFEHLPIKDRLILWLLTGETGISSETIAYALSGIKTIDMEQAQDKPYRSTSFCWSVPRNPSDFRSCMFLLEYIPEWRERLPEVAERFPAWEPFVKRWDEFERLYKKGKDVELYRRIMVLRGIA